VNDEEYENEGLSICVKWFIQILEQKPNKKDQETIKKLKSILDDVERSIKEAQALQPASVGGAGEMAVDEGALVRGVFNNPL
jgi:hypothetical protein